MADIIQNEDLNDKKKTMGSQGTAGPSTSVTQPQTGGAPSAVKSQPQGGAGPKQGSGFTNLQKIMSASNPSKLGQAVTGGVQKQVQQTQQGLQQSQQQFQQGLQQSQQQYTSPEDQARIQRVMNDPTSATQEDYAAFDKYRTQAYTGPTNLQNVDQLRAQTQQTQALAGLANTQGGKEALLQRFVAAPSYTAGQRNLDSALLGSSASPALRQQAREASALQRILEQQSGAAQAQAQQATSEVDKRRQDLLNNLESAEQDLGQQLKERTEAYNTEQQNRYNTYLDQLKKGQLDSQTAQALGGLSGGRTYGVDLTRFLNQAGPATAQQLASKDEYARAQALAKLSGQQTSDIGLNDPSLAGTAQSVGFDKTAYQNAVDNAKQSYQTQLQGIYQNLGLGGDYGNKDLESYLQQLVDKVPQVQQLQNQVKDFQFGMGDAIMNAARQDYLTNQAFIASQNPQFQQLANLLSQTKQKYGTNLGVS